MYYHHHWYVWVFFFLCVVCLRHTKNTDECRDLLYFQLTTNSTNTLGGTLKSTHSWEYGSTCKINAHIFVWVITFLSFMLFCVCVSERRTNMLCLPYYLRSMKGKCVLNMCKICTSIFFSVLSTFTTRVKIQKCFIIR